jgi:exonuclease SbcD
VRLLHVSDWHIGRVTYRHSRAPDHDAVLAEMLAVARENAPDLVLHTGDLFDSPRPAVEDMHRAVAALREFAAVAPVLVIAGNHDSPALFGLFNRLLAPTARLRFMAEPLRGPAGVPRYAACSPGGRDEHTIRVAALPFVRDTRLVGTFEEPSTWLTSYADRVAAMEGRLGAELTAGFDPTREVAVFAAHLHVSGATWSGSERPIHVSDAYATTARAIPSQVAYAAFGHLHKPQPLPGRRIRGAFVGSPLQLDFTEADEAKRVILVEANPGRRTTRGTALATVHSIPLTAGRRLRAFTGTLDELAGLAPDWGDALTNLVVRVPTATPDLADRVRALLPDAALVEVLEDRADSRLDVVDERTGSGTDGSEAESEPSVTELFRAFLAENGASQAPAGAVERRFGDLLAAAEAWEKPAPAHDELMDRLTAVAGGRHPAAELGSSPASPPDSSPKAIPVPGRQR